MAALAASVALAASAAAQPRDTLPDTWEATDGLGRALPTTADVGQPRSDRRVFVFYYMWQQRNAQPAVYDISKIISGHTQPFSDAPWGPSPAFHWWAEPALGYYDANDDFVIRKHAQLLADAGVDAIVLDVTNALTYDATWQKICDVYAELRSAGNPTPAIAFIANSSSDATVQHLYDTLYSQNQCAGLLVQWLGKPLILAKPGAGLSQAAADYFTFRQSWAWTNPDGWFGNGQDKWPWLDNFPQNFGWHDDAQTPEEIAVGVAQHPTGNYGRSHHGGTQPALGADYTSADTANGVGFQEQWDRALEVDPPLVFVTQWNEWIAQRFVKCGTYDTGATQFLGQPLGCGDTHFIDEFNAEFSRDIEPMRGGFGDAYYYQLAANVRRYKGARSVPEASAPKAIDLASFDDWADVGPEFLDDSGDVTHRDAQAYSGPTVYTNDSGRNDIVLAKVARDSETLYFYVKSNSELSPSSDSAWMWLLLDTDANAETGLYGFDAVVNRTRTDDSTSVERYSSDAASWMPAGVAGFYSVGDELALAVPRAALDLPASEGELSFRFKWADNLADDFDALALIDQGDVAPNGRFMYRYHAALDDAVDPAGSGGEANGGDGSGGGATPSGNGGQAGTSGGAAPQPAAPSAAAPERDSVRGSCACSVPGFAGDVTRMPFWLALALGLLALTRSGSRGCCPSCTRDHWSRHCHCESRRSGSAWRTPNQSGSRQPSA